MHRPQMHLKRLLPIKNFPAKLTNIDGRRTRLQLIRANPMHRLQVCRDIVAMIKHPRAQLTLILLLRVCLHVTTELTFIEETSRADRTDDIFVLRIVRELMTS